MASLLRFSAVAAMINAVAGLAVSAVPSQTFGIGGIGHIFPAPTAAPSMELVKRKLAKKSYTNVCSDWTISGGGGQPQCFESQTCVFTTASGYFYEGCGLEGVRYDWITQCWDYRSQTTTAALSETICSKSEPYCGYFGFVLAPGYTFYNFGCGTSSYAVLANLVSTFDFNVTSATADIFDFSSFTSTSVRSTAVYTTSTSSRRTTATATSAFSTSTSTSFSSSNIGSHTQKTVSLAAIVGGVIAGLAVISIIFGLVVFCCVKKRRSDRAKRNAIALAQQQQANAAAAAALQNQQNPQPQIPEIAGTMKPVPYNPSPHGVYGEKQPGYTNTQEIPQTNVSPLPVYATTVQPTSAISQQTSTPSTNYSEMYAAPTSSLAPTSPPQNYSEMDNQESRRASSVMPISPMSTGQTPIQTPGSLHPHPEARELVGTPPPASELSSSTGTWIPSPAQEMSAVSASGGVTRKPVAAESDAVEMSAASTGGVNRRPVQPQNQRFDMSGAPMSDEFHGHELP